MNYLLVFLGGGLGSIIRLAINKLFPFELEKFPLATFTANIISCVLFGIAVGLFSKGNLNDSQKLFLTTGICGGFSTFSAFSYESFLYLQNGSYLLFIFNVFGSIIGCMLALYIGMRLI